MKRFSTNQGRIFETHAASPPTAQNDDGDWIDLYELLEVPPETNARDIDETIIGRGADVVYFTFSRTGKPAEIRKLERYLHDMRPILLDPSVRRRYDAQRKLHQAKDPHAMTYEDFKKTLDLREYSGGCMTSLIFLIASPLALLLCRKFIG